MADPHIEIIENGPYVVSGAVSLSEQALGLDRDGNTWNFVSAGAAFPDLEEPYALCRCGQSANKPFCDGSHQRVGFDGTETATREHFASQAEVIEGLDLDLADAPALCAFARICDGHGRIWNTVRDSDDPQTRAIVIHQGGACPSGRLVLSTREDHVLLEPAYEPAIVLLEDPQQDVSGPIWARGRFALVGCDGEPYETRNRVTLCRCGQSQNKPFCDGTHAHVGFRAHQ